MRSIHDWIKLDEAVVPPCRPSLPPRPTDPTNAEVIPPMRHVFAVVVLSLGICALRALAEDWTEFRGPTGQGNAGEGLPGRVGTGEERRLETEPSGGRMVVADCVQGSRLHLTATAVAGKDLSLRALCSGREVGQDSLERRKGALPAVRQDGSSSQEQQRPSPTPITDGKRLYVHFGHMGTACLDLGWQGVVASDQISAMNQSTVTAAHPSWWTTSADLQHRRQRQAVCRRPGHGHRQR